jgi:hypothetical protein
VDAIRHIENRLTLLEDERSLSIVDHSRREQAQARMTMLLVIPREEPLNPRWNAVCSSSCRPAWRNGRRGGNSHEPSAPQGACRFESGPPDTTRGMAISVTERRSARRFEIQLPLIVRWTSGSAVGEAATESRDVSSRGV